MTDRQMKNRLEKLAALDEQARALKAEAEAIRAEIVADLGDAETRTSARFIVRYQTITSNTFDTSRFKKEHARLYDEYTTPKTTRRFTYKLT